MKPKSCLNFATVFGRGGAGYHPGWQAPQCENRRLPALKSMGRACEASCHQLKAMRQKENHPKRDDAALGPSVLKHKKMKLRPSLMKMEVAVKSRLKFTSHENIVSQ
jgi:hypothetical protein